MAADVVQFELKNEAGALLRTFPLPLHKLDATAAPGAADDDQDGFAPGSLWMFPTATPLPRVFVCAANGTNNAEWLELVHDGGAGASAWTTVKKTADEARDFDTTLATDAALQFAMEANTKYSIRIRVWFDTGAAGDFKYALTGPASPTLVRVRRSHLAPQTTTPVSAVDTAYTSSTSVTDPVGSNGGWIEIDAIVHNGANAGTFSFDWAQNTSDATPATVRAGSYLEYATL